MIIWPCWLDLLTVEILSNLPRNQIVSLNQIINAVLSLGYFPGQWKPTKIIIIPKPRKLANEIKSQRAIILLHELSKIADKIIANRLLTNNTLIPNHQFDFWQNHGTTEQIYVVVNTYNQLFNNKATAMPFSRMSALP